jgi:hypothetical protein
MKDPRFYNDPAIFILLLVIFSNGCLFYKLGYKTASFVLFGIALWVCFGDIICHTLKIHEGDKKPNSMRHDMP